MTLLPLLLSVALSADGDFQRDLGDQGSIEIVAVGQSPTGPWWKPDGSPTDKNYQTFPPTQGGPPGEMYRVLIVRVEGEEGTDLVLNAYSNSTSLSQAAPSGVTVDGESADDLKGMMIYVQEAKGPWEATVRGIVAPWKHGLCTVPSRWRTTDDRAAIKSLDDLPMFIVRERGDDATQFNAVHGVNGHLVRTYAMSNGEKFEGSSQVIGPLLRMKDGKMETSSDMFGVQSVFDGAKVADVDRVVIEIREYKDFAFPKVAENPAN